MADNQKDPGSKGTKIWAASAVTAYTAAIAATNGSYDATRDLKIKLAECQDLYNRTGAST